MPAALGAVLAAPAEGLQVAQRVVAAQDHVAAAAAVAAVGAALGDVGFAPEGQRTVAAAPGPDLDSRAIGQHSPGNDRTMVFLIAGASTGIGAATARHAAEAGHQVVLAARSADKLEALAQETGGLAVPTDLTEYSQVERLVERAGRIDVVFANAGIGFPRGFTEGDPEQAKQVVLDQRLRHLRDDPGDRERAARDARATS